MSCIFSWSLTECLLRSRLLVRYPDVLKKLRSEIDSVLGQDKDVTRAYIQRMPYLQNILKESK